MPRYIPQRIENRNSDTYKVILTEALFIIVKMWKQCSVHSLTNKHVYTFDGILLSLKRKEILTRVTTWMNLKDIMLKEVSQIRDKYCMVSLI